MLYFFESGKIFIGQNWTFLFILRYEAHKLYSSTFKYTRPQGPKICKFKDHLKPKRECQNNIPIIGHQLALNWTNVEASFIRHFFRPTLIFEIFA